MTTKEFEQKIKRVLITEEEIQAVGAAIQARPEVARMDYQSADQAWEDYKQKYF